MGKGMKYSIIVPVFNMQDHIESCINNILNLNKGNFSYEIILIDDCSLDKSWEILQGYALKYNNIKIFKTKKNGGPGIARNIGIENACGDWIIFLDCDDNLSKDSLINFTNFIQTNDIDDNSIIAFNWEFKNKKDYDFCGRYDFNYLMQTKEKLIKDYIALRLDNSVIYTLFSKKILNNYNIRFRSGFHEDVDFIFKAYLYTKKIFILDKKIYIKNNRFGSIVNTVSEKHIDGFFDSFEEIFDTLKNTKYRNDNEILKYFCIGIIGVIATRIINIWNKCDLKKAEDLYRYLYCRILKLNPTVLKRLKEINIKTKYLLIYRFFIDNFNKNDIADNINNFLIENVNKSYSCYDLHNSLFLSHNEIRTCCKRFFVNGKMKGDVVLLKENFTVKNILNAKKALLARINQDEAIECKGCPFLEFKEWGYINKLKVEHISFEYHSICNMKCNYCSADYYGGKQANYNINSLIDELINTKSLDNLKSIVWGGGEPVLEKNFINLLTKIVTLFPKTTCRVITNATIFKKEIENFIKNNDLLITTSIDAGTKETFLKVRKNDQFLEVFKNLQKYSKYKPENITIKYIILDENSSLNELKGFVDLVSVYELQKCNFQISFDFKKNIIDKDSLLAIIILYGLLKESNVKLVFIDDLLRQRIPIIDNEVYNYLKYQLQKNGFDDFLIDINKYKEIIIWGAGTQAREFILKSYFLKHIKIKYIVDDNYKNISNIYDYKVYPPKKILDNDLPILILASQSSPFILKKCNEMKISLKRIIDNFIL